MDFSLLLPTLLTKEDADLLLGAADSMEQSLYTKHTTPLPQLISSMIGEEQATALINTAAKNNISPASSEQFISFMKALKEYIKSLPVIELTLAFTPDRQTIQQTVEWLRTDVQNNALVSFTVSKDILGGAILVYKGKYKDISLVKQISDMLDAKKASLTAHETGL